MRKHFEVIDILRGLSALAVAVFHVRVDLWAGWHTVMAEGAAATSWDRAIALLSLPTPVFGEAVMLFFIVSGFCVHYQYAAGRKELHLGRYAIRRGLRIYPPYIAAVALTLGVELLLTKLSAFSPSGKAKFIETALMIQNYPPGPGQLIANPSLWSLPVEAEFYILYPLLVLCRRWFGVGWWVAISMVVSLAAAALYLCGVTWLAGNFAEYWVLWCAGALIAERVAIGQTFQWCIRKTAGLVVSLIGGCISVLMAAPLVIQHLIWGVFFFLLIILCLAVRPFHESSDSLAWRALLKLGAISYSLYLIHYPLFKLAGVIWIGIFGEKPMNFLVPLLWVVAIIPFAYGFYVLFERPSCHLARRFSAGAGDGTPDSRVRQKLAVPSSASKG